MDIWISDGGYGMFTSNAFVTFVAIKARCGYCGAVRVLEKCGSYDSQTFDKKKFEEKLRQYQKFHNII